jgi:hypothetical protein
MHDFVAPKLRALTAQLDEIREELRAADKLAGERHSALLERLEAARRELSLKIELALVSRKLEELQDKQQGSAAQ